MFITDLITADRASGTLHLRFQRALKVAVCIGAIGSLHALTASAQTAKEVKGPTELVAIPDEAPPKLVVDPPIAEQLALGRVMIQYRTEHLRIEPVFGKGALSVSPRLGHLHYYVDDNLWPVVDSGGNTVVLVGLKPGAHKVRFELAQPTHQEIPGTSQTVSFTVPDTSSASH
jgi:hypothetical protein